MHGPTFMGNPLACAVAKQSIDLLLESDWANNIKRIEANLLKNLSSAIKNDTVKDVRVLGGIGVIEMHNPVDTVKAQHFFVEHGVWVRPFGNLIYIMPPYIISEKDLTKVCRTMVNYTKN